MRVCSVYACVSLNMFAHPRVCTPQRHGTTAPTTLNSHTYTPMHSHMHVRMYASTHPSTYARTHPRAHAPNILTCAHSRNNTAMPEAPIASRSSTVMLGAALTRSCFIMIFNTRPEAVRYRLVNGHACIRVCIQVYRHVYKHVHGHMWIQMYRHVYIHV